MAIDKKEFDKLKSKLKRAKAVHKKTSRQYDVALATYHWTEADDGAKWKKVLALRDRNTGAFEKAEAAFEALAAAIRPR